MKSKALASVASTSLLLVLAVVSTAPSAYADYAGRIHKQNSRVVRPLPEDQIAPVSIPELSAGAVSKDSLNAEVAAEAFVLKADGLNGAAPSGIQDWNPFPASASRAAPIPTFVATRALQTQLQAPAAVQTAVDYDAVERTYEASAPHVALRAAGRCCGHTPLPMALLGAAGVTASGASVDYDNCACAEPIPTTECTRSRMVGFGVRVTPASSSTPTQNQTARILALPGVVPIPVVLPGVRIPAGVGFANQFR